MNQQKECQRATAAWQRSGPAHHTPPGRAPCPAGGEAKVHALPGRDERKPYAIIPQGLGLFNLSASRRPWRNRSAWSGKTPRGQPYRRRPGNLAIPAGGTCCGASVRRQGQKKRSPGSGAPHHAARKGERYQRLALKNASILSKGMMSTRSYRSVCEARGTIISSLLLPLSFLKASSLK